MPRTRKDELSSEYKRLPEDEQPQTAINIGEHKEGSLLTVLNEDLSDFIKMTEEEIGKKRFYEHRELDEAHCWLLLIVISGITAISTAFLYMKNCPSLEVEDAGDTSITSCDAYYDSAFGSLGLCFLLSLSCFCSGEFFRCADLLPSGRERFQNVSVDQFSLAVKQKAQSIFSVLQRPAVFSQLPEELKSAAENLRKLCKRDKISDVISAAKKLRDKIVAITQPVPTDASVPSGGGMFANNNSSAVTSLNVKGDKIQSPQFNNG